MAYAFFIASYNFFQIFSEKHKGKPPVSIPENSNGQSRKSPLGIRC